MVVSFQNIFKTMNGCSVPEAAALKLDMAQGF